MNGKKAGMSRGAALLVLAILALKGEGDESH